MWSHEHLKDDMDRGIPEIKRSYTPTEDGLGYTDLVVKVCLRDFSGFLKYIIREISREKWANS